MAPVGVKPRVTNGSGETEEKKYVSRPKKGKKNDSAVSTARWIDPETVKNGASNGNGNGHSAPKTVQFQIKPLNLKFVRIPIIGTSPLICNAMSERVKDEIEAKQTGSKKGLSGQAREPRVPLNIFNEARYINIKGQDCVRSLGIKSAIVESVRFLPGNQQGKVLAAATARGLMQVLDDLTPLAAPSPRMRRDAVRLESGVTSLAYRPEYWPWGLVFKLQYNADLIDQQGVFSLVQLAGFHSGLHEWRPERGGNFGMFVPATFEEFAKLQEEVKNWGDKVAPAVPTPVVPAGYEAEVEEAK